MPIPVETTLDTEILCEAVRGATESVFSLMLNMQVEPLEPRIVAQPDAVDGVVALLGFTGEWTGTGMFFSSGEFACRIGSTMLMTEVSEVNGDVLDGIGEMANMILGNFKESIEEKTGPMALSVPTVIYGKNFSTRAPLIAHWLIVPFRCEEARFEVRVCIKRNESC